MNKNIKSIFSVARSEYIKWIMNPRIIIIGVFLIFARTLAVEPLLEHVDKYGEPLNILEPFIAIGNCGYLVMIIPCVFLILISDYPKMTGNTLFFVQRTGKFNWFIGQLVFILMAIVSYLLIIFVGTVLVSKGDFSLNWSNTVTKYISEFTNESTSFGSLLLPSNLYNQLSIVGAVLSTFALLVAFLFMLSMIIYLFKLIHIQLFGLFAAIFVIAAGVVTCSLGTDLKWAFPTANSIVWIHYQEIFREQVVTMRYSCIYFISTITVLVTLNCIAVKRFEYMNIELVE